ncbi:MAG: hypothetical protein IT443_09135 [Phycisphaeraceae bacterium]|nr:hypothetical protein [Phycisphaeraceae bacterium]
MPASLCQWWTTLPSHAPAWQGLRTCLETHRFAGSALAALPGTWLATQTPVCSLYSAQGVLDRRLLADLDAALPADFARKLSPPPPRQIYRQLDEEGRFRQDILLPIDADPLPGMVVLQQVWAENRWLLPMPSESETSLWIARQQPALPADPLRYPVLTTPPQNV